MDSARQDSDDPPLPAAICIRTPRARSSTGKAKNLRARVRSYFLAANQQNAKTGSLMREGVDLDYITVANGARGLALGKQSHQQRKPRFNILLARRQDLPYIKLTLADRYPKSSSPPHPQGRQRILWPVFSGQSRAPPGRPHPSQLPHPSCKVDLERYHPRACLQYYIKRCLGPCVEGLTTPDAYRQTVRDVQLFP